ncbi:MAG: ABC transporter permease subunit, partial [Treponema sp.]|nr:ABC transporter permease subunit [Treponema sp.]
MNLKNRLRFFFKKPHNVILVSLAVVLGFLTLFPLLSLIRDTVVVHPAEVMSVRGVPIGGFTTFHWQKILLDGETSLNIFFRPLWNTLYTSLWSCVVSILLGGIVAWLVTRSDIKWKSFISVAFIFPYIMPAWTMAMAWQNFFRNRLIGGAQGLFTAITGIETANWFAYGAFPIIIVQGLHYAPFAYILIGGILRNMDANLEEAALILKTSRLKIFTRITIPIVMPAILSTFLLVFSGCMSSFAVPAFLGLPVRFQVLTTQLFRTLNGLNPGYGYIMALVMIVFGTGILLFQQWFVGKRKSFTTVTGKSSNISLVKLKRSRLPISLALVAVVGLIAIMPLATFALESFIMAPGNYSPSNFTLQFWTG